MVVDGSVRGGLPRGASHGGGGRAPSAIQPRRPADPGRTVSRATGRTARRGRPTCGSTFAKTRSTPRPSCPATRTRACWSSGSSAPSRERMPPPKSHKTLSEAEKETLVRWIARGPSIEPHWSFMPAKRPEPPAVKGAAWVRNPIDRFILARLEAEGLAPAPEADRRTLARRVALDLTGLPPIAGGGRGVRRRRVGRRLREVRRRLARVAAWGEHRGRYWLDAARYADTHGIHFDNYREMWSYRDWVIEAFNRNLPFDQFTIEQSGRRPAARRRRSTSGSPPASIAATSRPTRAASIDEEYLVLYARDRTETTATVWLGLTAGCAVCHDHKFDPISQKEFYAAGGVLQQHDAGAMDGNIKDTPPMVVVPLEADARRWSELNRWCRGRAEGRRPKGGGTRRTSTRGWPPRRPVRSSRRSPPRACTCTLPLDEGKGPAVAVLVDGNKRRDAAGRNGPMAGRSRGCPGGEGLGARRRPRSPTPATSSRRPAVLLRRRGSSFRRTTAAGRSWRAWTTSTTTAAGTCGSRRRKVGTHIDPPVAGDALKVVASDQVPAEPVDARGGHLRRIAQGRRREDLRQRRAARRRRAFRPTRSRTRFAPTVPLAIGQRHRASILSDAAIQDLRIYRRALAPTARSLRAGPIDARTRPSLAKPADQRTDAEKNELLRLVAAPRRTRRIRRPPTNCRGWSGSRATSRPGARSPT